MCGIAGVWTSHGFGPGKLTEITLQMGNAVRHRGPDASGLWIDEEVGIGFCHNRLAIVDPSTSANQPFISASGRYVMNYNGEIYNHEEIRKSLILDGRSPMWRSQSDTETLVAAIDAWGLLKTLEFASGMFAFALWDRAEKKLYLARDRIGEKPLYYGCMLDAFVFGSELSVITAHPGFSSSIDLCSVASLLGGLYIPEPHSIYTGVKKLLPGHLIEIVEGIPKEPVPWWSFRYSLAEQYPRFNHDSFSSTIDRLDGILNDAVLGQINGNIEVGCFLSGGIDSSLIAAIAQRNSEKSIKTYTIGFSDSVFNEAPFAANIAKYLGTNHTEATMTDGDVMAIVQKLPSVYGEPFADASQIPSIFISNLARRDVKVALTGDGGDEIFGGYHRYLSPPGIWRLFSRMPVGLRRTLSTMETLRLLERSLDRLSLASSQWKLSSIENNTLRLNRLIALVKSCADLRLLYTKLVSVDYSPQKLFSDDFQHEIHPYKFWGLQEFDFRQTEDPRWMMESDAVSLLPGDLLVKMDRASMSASLETRSPFLNLDVMIFARSLPTKYMIKNDESKYCLRRLLSRYIPQELFLRPKKGFSVPLDNWLRTSLKEWAGDLLSREMIQKVGILSPTKTDRIWALHQSGRVNYGNQIWAMLMLQQWFIAKEPLKNSHDYRT